MTFDKRRIYNEISMESKGCTQIGSFSIGFIWSDDAGLAPFLIIQSNMHNKNINLSISISAL